MRYTVLLLTLYSVSLQAQWLNFKEANVPRTADGKVNLTAPTPKAAGGKPDLSGVWIHEVTTLEEMLRLFPFFAGEARLAPPGMEIGTQHKYGINILVDFQPQDSPVRPEATALMSKKAAAPPPAPCSTIAGFPLAGLLSEPIKIVQNPKITMILYEIDNLRRQIYTDGRALPKEFAFPAFMGYSVGHWEGDVFLVETAGFNDKTAIDGMGHPRSEAMKVTERFRRRDYGHLELEMTFDDPVMYTRPFTVKIPHTLMPDTDIFEMFCENERDAEHLKKP